MGYVIVISIIVYIIYVIVTQVNPLVLFGIIFLIVSAICFYNYLKKKEEDEIVIKEKFNKLKELTSKRERLKELCSMQQQSELNLESKIQSNKETLTDFEKHLNKQRQIVIDSMRKLYGEEHLSVVSRSDIQIGFHQNEILYAWEQPKKTLIQDGIEIWRYDRQTLFFLNKILIRAETDEPELRPFFGFRYI